MFKNKELDQLSKTIIDNAVKKIMPLSPTGFSPDILKIRQAAKKFTIGMPQKEY